MDVIAPSTPAAVLAKERAKAASEGLELAMLRQLTALGLTDGMARQFSPIQGRRFRVDFAWPMYNYADGKETKITNLHTKQNMY